MSPVREKALRLTISFFFILLIAGLLYTQIFRFPFYSRLSKNNVIRIIPIDGPRGIIFDRKGVPLVTNRLSFDVAVVYQELNDKEKVIRVLSECLEVPRQDIMRSLAKASTRPYAPVTIREDINKEKAIYLEEMSSDVSGIVIETHSRRHYVYDDMGSHVFGYLGEINEEELEGL